MKIFNFILISIHYLTIIVMLIFFLCAELKSVKALQFDDLDVDYVNGDYINMSNLEISVNRKKNSPNTINVNIQIIKELESNFSIKLRVTTRTHGYQLPTGLEFQSKLCDKPSLARELYDIAVTAAGIQECPPKKGFYQVRDLEYDFSKLDFAFLRGARLQCLADIFVDGITKILQLRFFILT